jgi:hypothetical protein
LRHFAINSFIDSPLDVSRVDVGHEVRIGNWMNILYAAYSEVHHLPHLSRLLCLEYKPPHNNASTLLCAFVAEETYFNRTVVEIDTQQFFCFCVRIRCRGNLFNKTLPSNWLYDSYLTYTNFIFIIFVLSFDGQQHALSTYVNEEYIYFIFWHKANGLVWKKGREVNC